MTEIVYQNIIQSNNIQFIDQKLHGERLTSKVFVVVCFAGTTLYNKVYAEDAAGHRSKVIVSDGVRVDTTPPVALDMVYTNGVNYLYNPSFEVDTALNADLTQCDAQPPTSWEVMYDALTR